MARFGPMSQPLFRGVMLTSLVVAFASSIAVLISGDQRFAIGICVGLVGIFTALEKSPRPQDRGGTGPTGEAGTPYTGDADVGGVGCAGGGDGGGGG